MKNITNVTIHSRPDTVQKLTQMGDVTLFEPAGDAPRAESPGSNEGQAHRPGSLPCVSYVQTPKGAKPVLKTMVTTACEKDCYYCPFRAGRSKMKRVTFSADELAATFDQMQRAKLVDGLFLSSGIIKGGMTTQDKVIDTVEIVRQKYGYSGYVHLKIMPGAEYDQIARAMQIADRVSINLEAPTQQRLDALAPKKDFEGELLQRIKWAHEIRRRFREARASIVTQFVVGAVGDTDLELLTLSARLYGQLGLARAYYSAFSPVEQTPLENVAPTPDIRERRLYQSSFLLRDYAWDVEDLPFLADGNLLTTVDPKRAWADQHLRTAPIDLMHADRTQLMRVPGIGPKGADAILKARRRGRLSDLAHLRQIGIHAPELAAPYILLDGRRPPAQLSLFE